MLIWFIGFSIVFGFCFCDGDTKDYGFKDSLFYVAVIFAFWPVFLGIILREFKEK